MFIEGFEPQTLKVGIDFSARCAVTFTRPFKSTSKFFLLVSEGLRLKAYFLQKVQTKDQLGNQKQKLL